MARPRFEFGLRSLLLITVVGAMLGVVGRQVIGRIQTEGGPYYFTDYQWFDLNFRTGTSPSVEFVCESDTEADRLRDTFDADRFQALAADAKETAPNIESLLTDFSVTPGCNRQIFFLKYDVSMWGRYRLDIQRLQYVHDTHDPVAATRNAAWERAFQQAAERYVREVRNVNWRSVSDESVTGLPD